MPDSRELATLILLGACLAGALLNSGARAAVLGVLRAFVAKAVLVFFSTFILGLGLIIWLASLIGLWTPALLTQTVFWTFATGFVWLLSLGNSGQPGFMSRRFRESIGLAVLMEFWINLEPLPFWLELPLQATLILLSMLYALASGKPEYGPVETLSGGILGIVAFVLVIYSSVAFVDGIRNEDWIVRLQQFILPFWLLIASAPFIYFLALISAYEILIKKVRWYRKGASPKAVVVLGLASSLLGSLVDIHGVARSPEVYHVAHSSHFRQVRSVVARFKAARKKDLAERRAARERLEQFSGIAGHDSDGRLLDRREFAATKSALMWLWACHSGWHDRNDRYRADVLELLGDFERHGLRNPHGIKAFVAPEGRAWYAYRSTPSGWVFAIGAAEKPPDAWRYDGPVPPPGYPSEENGWTRSYADTSPEWEAESAT